jgi:surface carbohydrate biosynthesis protein
MVVRMLARLWRFVSYFAFARKIWRWPQRSELLIFDAEGKEFLLEYCGPWNPEVLHVRGERINVPVMLSSFFRGGKISEAYIDCYIEKVDPRMIVTFIDNSSVFYSLSGKHHRSRTMLIQNGIRGCELFEALAHAGPKVPSLCVDYMMTFSDAVGELYSRHIAGEVIPIGSLRNNLFVRGAVKKSNVIAFISQYRNIPGITLGEIFYPRKVFFERPDSIVLGFLVDYARRHGKELIIVPCSGTHKDNTFGREQAYYTQLLGQQLQFAKERQGGSSYEIIDSAEVVVTIDSTLGYESLGRGNKTAIFSIRKQLLNLPDRSFGWPAKYPDDGAFWTTQPDNVFFERIMDHLFAIGNEQWKIELARHDFEHVMNYDAGNTILRTVLRRELGEALIRTKVAA